LPEGRRAPRSCLRAPIVAAALMLTFFLLVGGSAGARGAPFPPLPIALDRDFVGNLSGPTMVPGAQTALTFSVSNPLSGTIANVVVTLAVYAFNGFPGNATSTVPIAGAPTLSSATGSGTTVTVPCYSILSHDHRDESVGVVTSASTPAGAFAVRVAMSFTLAPNGTAYELESRGWFSDATWKAATELPNGSATLNLSVLGVSGVLPETAVYVANSSWDWVLGAVLAAAIVLVGAAAWVYFRKGPGSTSGTR
jgi:hypothetical protein